MSLEVQYFVCCKAGFRFTETEFRTMPTRRRRQYLQISDSYHKLNKEEMDKLKH